MKFPHIPYKWLLAGPVAAFVIGSALNMVVIAANGGAMPVLPPGGLCSLLNPDDVSHVCMNSGTHLKIIADWLLMDSGHTVASPGDFLIWLADGIWWPSLTAWAALMIKGYNPYSN